MHSILILCTAQTHDGLAYPRLCVGTLHFCVLDVLMYTLSRGLCYDTTTAPLSLSPRVATAALTS